MFKYVLKRILWMIPVLFGAVFIVFSINRLSPGDPVAASLGANYTQEQYDRVEAEMGLDKPFFAQFYEYLKGIVTEFDLGTSYKTKRPVAEEIKDRFPVTLKLALIGCAITICIGIPCGVISATKQYSIADYIVTIFSLIFASMPGFWLGLMMILLFALNLRWLPASGLQSWKSWIMPAIAVGISSIATITRLTRSSMLDVIRQDYIRTARAKGQSEPKIVVKHALRNGIIPIVTTIGFQLGTMIAGSVVVESIFSIPGLGTLITTAVSNQDYDLIQGCVLVLAAVVCVLNLIIDILYGFIDPRIQAEFSGGKRKRKNKVN
ncbi:MAG: ABC transporter permease [Oscillospiraceae bacterium]|nr:ABC transporter permease [Oscillospiraceae bacterium]